MNTSEESDCSGDLSKPKCINNSASCKIVRVMENVFFPMLNSQHVKSFTSFDPIDTTDVSLIDHIALEQPEIVKSKFLFLEFMSHLYDEWTAS